MEEPENLSKGKKLSWSNPSEHTAEKRDTGKNKGAARESLDEWEKEVILKTLESVDWNISKGSVILGIARNTLYRKMDKYGIEVKNY
jgi:transcriptional regulator of acetoin/glycerol metabolism